MSNYKNPLSRFFGFAICALALVASSNGQTAPVYTPAETFDQVTPAPTAAVQPVDGKIGDGQGNSTVICANIPGVTSIPSGLTKDTAGNCVATTSAPGKSNDLLSPRNLTILWWVLGGLLLAGLIIWLLRRNNRNEEEDNGHNDDHTPRNRTPVAHVHQAPEPAEMPNFGAPEEHPVVKVTTATTPLPATTVTATATATPPMPHLPGAALIIGGLLLLGALGAVPAQAGMSGLCDNANVMSFAPAAGYRGQSSVSVVDGSFQNVTGVKFAGSGVTASLSSVTANQLVINWTVAPNASLATKQIAVSCSDGSSKVFPLYFRVAENVQQLQAAEMAWGMIPASVQKSMNAPAAAPQTVYRTTYKTDPATLARLTAIERWQASQSSPAPAPAPAATATGVGPAAIAAATVLALQKAGIVAVPTAAPASTPAQVSGPPAPPVYPAPSSVAPAPIVASATAGGGNTQMGEVLQRLGVMQSSIDSQAGRINGVVQQVNNLQGNVRDLNQGMGNLNTGLGAIGGFVAGDGKNKKQRCERIAAFIQAGIRVPNADEQGCKKQ